MVRLMRLLLLLTLASLPAMAQTHVFPALDTVNPFTNVNIFSVGALMGPRLFATLPTESNGTIVYCADCQVSNPCVGSGTGAYASGSQGVWSCTFGLSVSGSGVTGSGTPNTFPIWTGTTSIGNSSTLTNVSGPAGINYSIGSGQSWQIDASHLSWNTGVGGSSNVIIANTFQPASSNNAGGIVIQGAPASGSAVAGAAILKGGSTGSGADNNGATISANGGGANGFGPGGADVVLTGGSTTASNPGGSIDLYPGTGNFGNGVINFGLHNSAAPVVVWHNGATSNNTFTEELSSLPSSWTFKWPGSATDMAGELTMVSGTKTYTWQGTYTTHPKCAATDETAIAATQITYSSTTSFTINTSGSTDVVSYVCLGGS